MQLLTINTLTRPILLMLKVVTLSTLLSLFSILKADDTEVFFAPNTAINPNVLFIMDNSTSMAGPDNPKGSPLIGGQSRMEVMKEALSTVLNGNQLNNVNVGISNYGSAEKFRNDHSNGIKFPLLPLNTLVKPIIEDSLRDMAGNIQWRHHRQPAPAGNGQLASINPVVDHFDALTVREYLPEVAKAWTADGNTPIVDALYEAALYFRGGAIRWQDLSGYGGRGDYRAAAHPSTYHYPNGVSHISQRFPNADFPFIPQWYADHLSSSFGKRSVVDKGPGHPRPWSYFRNFKYNSPDWYTSWIKCPSNTGSTGSPKYEGLLNSGPSTLYNCRIMRNDFVKYLNQKLGGVAFQEAVDSIVLDEADHNRGYWLSDNEIQNAIRAVSDADLEAVSSEKEEYRDDHLTSYHFAEFPRCRVITERRCEDGTEATNAEEKAKYRCTTDNPESCRARNYEQCQDPADGYLVNEVVCDFDKNNSRYPDVNYTSPIVGDCQSNYIVLMSDGKPEYSRSYPIADGVEDSRIKSRVLTQVQTMLGDACAEDPYFAAGTCGPQLTKYLATTDNMPDDAIAKGKQVIKTMVIGFSDTVSENSNTKAYLESLVTFEDDPLTINKKEGFFIATDKAELVSAFTDALNGIIEVARSQASPGYSVNVKSGLEHENAIYIPVFNKKNASSWSGNLKKFTLVDAVVNGKTYRHIRGKTAGVDAMNELGIFKDEAWDLWSESTSADGKTVEKGGAASLLDNPAQRNLFSDITSDKGLWKDENKLSPENDNITNSMLDANNNAHREKLIRYIRGWKDGVFTNGVARKHMGDMLHSEPVIITYPEVNGVKKQVVFAATNEGYLHAFDAATGEEEFAFMPKQLLKNIKRQFEGDDGVDLGHIYGIDGGISYVKDGSNIYLYFGLRRGGKAYYALNITDLAEPRLMWKIDGETDSQFSHLGQSWSMPYIANVLHGGVKKTVVVFSGGNDTKFDYGRASSYVESSVTDAKTADVGNDIYIVNAKTGVRLWSMRDTMGRTDVEHAIPGGVRILDVNANGLLDRMYFADTGGNVWRLDLHENLSDPTKSKMVKLAKLGGEGVNRRKFYTEPDVAQLNDNGSTIFTVSVGSGIRPHPLNTVIDDHMFILLDKNPMSTVIETGSGAYDLIEKSDLANVAIATSVNAAGKVLKTLTHNDFTQNTQAVSKITQTDKRGWYVDFADDGEKVLSSSITFEGSLIFTTIVPSATTSGLQNSCKSPVTQGRLYAMNILTGEASIDIERDNDVDDNDVFGTISSNEIPGKPQRIFNGLDCTNGVCKHKVDVRIGKKNSEVGSKDVSKVESIYWNAPE